MNMFFSPDKGKTIMISTATSFLQGPKLSIECRYPIMPTNKKYETVNCKHSFVHHCFQQLRRGDEAPTVILRCELCNMLTVH